MNDIWKKIIRAAGVLAGAAALLCLAALADGSGIGGAAGTEAMTGTGSSAYPGALAVGAEGLTGLDNAEAATETASSGGSAADAAFGTAPGDLVLSELKADLTGDGKEDTIRIGARGLQKEEDGLPVQELLHRGKEAVVAILDGAAAAEAPACLKEYSFSVSHVGNGNLALTEYQGKPCLLLYDNTVYTGIGSFWYDLHEILPEGGSRTLAEDIVSEYYINYGPEQSPKGISDLMPDYQDRVKASELERVCLKLDDFLKDATILAALSVQGSVYLYTQEEPFSGTGMELLSGWNGESPQSSVRELVRSWQQEAESNWLYQKAEMDEGWREAYAALDSVWENVKLLEQLKYGGLQDDGKEIKLREDETGTYRRITDSRFSSIEGIENLIAATYAGIAAAEWREALLENGFYREQDGALYRKMADYVAVSLPTKNILAYARISEDEWFVTVESGRDMLGQPIRTSISLLRERDGWRISDVEAIVDCNGFACS